MLEMMVFGSCVVIPLIFAIFFQGIIRISSYLKRKKIHVTDLLFPVLLVAIHILSVVGFQKSMLLYFFASFMIIGMGVAIYQGVAEGEIRYGHFFKMFWRAGFILALVIYLILIGFDIYILFIQA